MYEIKYYGSDGCVRYLGDTHLSHYNHNHDRLGRFARSSVVAISKSNSASTGKQYKKQLKKMDRIASTARGKAMEADYKGKMGNANKREKYQAKAKEYRNVESEANKQASKLVEKALNDHYDVSMQEVYRNSKKNKDIAMSIVAASAINPLISVPGYNIAARASSKRKYGNTYGGENPRKVRGTRYNVTPSNSKGKRGKVYK